MKKAAYITTTGYILATVGLIHLLRLIYGWYVLIGSWVVPMWFSVVAVVVAGYLAMSAFKMK